MEHEPTNRRGLLWGIIAALAAWGLLLALGAYLGIDSETPDYDWRRVAVVAICVGGFLMLWLGALAFGKKR